MNNSVFAKTIENIRKRKDVKLITDPCNGYKLSFKPNFKKTKIFNEHLSAFYMNITKIYFNKPIYLGQKILDISKSLMYDFHYNYIKKKYFHKAKRLMTLLLILIH